MPCHEIFFLMPVIFFPGKGLLHADGAWNFLLHTFIFICYPQTLSDSNGAVAQLGERMNGIHEVEGSIPFGSTI
jgi:hypothetical protein